MSDAASVELGPKTTFKLGVREAFAVLSAFVIGIGVYYAVRTEIHDLQSQLRASQEYTREQASAILKLTEAVTDLRIAVGQLKTQIERKP